MNRISQHSPMTWRWTFESMSPKAATILMTGVDTQASKTLPINVLGTDPGNILWSYSIATNFRKTTYRLKSSLTF